MQQRVRDFAVRRALGATSTDVLRLVLHGAIRVVGAGAVIGLVLSVVLSRLVATLLDPITFAAVAVMLLLTAAVAIAAPAWRATQIDPAAALRSE